jgi:hypothetical protein
MKNRKKVPVKDIKRRLPQDWMEPFLATLAKTANVRLACQMAGISRALVYQYRETDPAFKDKWEHAKDDAIEILEAAARRRALQTSDTLMIFLLKAHRPEVYRDRYQHEYVGPNGGPVQVETVKLSQKEFESRLKEKNLPTRLFDE